jgi:lactobin A/cerein 7B family class IIb bacteriocin
MRELSTPELEEVNGGFVCGGGCIAGAIFLGGIFMGLGSAYLLRMK